MDGHGGEKRRGDGSDASHDQAWEPGKGWEPDNERAYWRRRFFILCGGVVALGVCAWLFPGAHQPPASAVAAARASVAALASQQALPSVAYGSAWPVPSKSAAFPTAFPTPSAKPASTAKKAGTATHPTPTTSASGGTAAASPCAPAHIVLSLSTSQSSYAKGDEPRFSVYAVSTASAACTLPYGAGSVRVVVTRHGRVVWDSAACKPPAAKPVRFTLGVPQVLTVIWNPAATKPAGCAGTLPAGASGTLDAVATSGGQSSPVRAFKFAG